MSSQEDWKARAEKAEIKLALLEEWSRTFGAHLCPPMGWSDSYGEGVRWAKDSVLRMLLAQSPSKDL